MPDIIASCHYCGKEHEYESTFAVDEDFGRCELCNNETCKSCCMKDNRGNEFDWHPDCHEESAEEDRNG